MFTYSSSKTSLMKETKQTISTVEQIPQQTTTILNTAQIPDSVSILTSQTPLTVQTTSIDSVLQVPTSSITQNTIIPPVLTPNQILPLIASEWAQSPILGQDVGISAEGDIYVVGVDGRLYLYNFLTNNYNKVITDPELDNIIRVDVDEEGTPYVVTNCGDSYYLSCDNKWIQLPGCATDIGVGFCGHIWKTGCDTRVDGFGVWKLFCKGKKSKCNRFNPHNYSCNKERYLDKEDCYWHRVSGAGVRISVYPDGKPVVIQGNGKAVKYNGKEWELITYYPGKDIAVSNDGMIIMSGEPTGLFFIPPTKETKTQEEFYDSRYGFTVLDPDNLYITNNSNKNKPNNIKVKFIDVGCTMSIASGPFSQPVCIPCANQYNPIVLMTQKFNFN